MSQNSLHPNSPTHPRSKSPSCHEMYGTEFEENQPAGSTLERLQREVEEELRYSNRLMISVNDLLAEDKGNILRNYCSHPSKTEENFRPILFSIPFCQHDAPPQKVSPPQTTVRCESRETFPGISQRGTGLPPPERITIKPRTISPPLRSYPIDGRGLESGVIKKKTPESLHYSITGDDTPHSQSSTGKGRYFDGARGGGHPLDGNREKDGPFDGGRGGSRPLDGTREKDRPFDGGRGGSRPLDGTREKDGPFEGGRGGSRPLDGTGEKDHPFDGGRGGSRPLDGTREKDGPFDGGRGGSRPLDGTREKDRPFDGGRGGSRPLDGTREKDGPFEGGRGGSRPLDGTGEKDHPFDGGRGGSRPLDGTREKDGPFDGGKGGSRPLDGTREKDGPFIGGRDRSRTFDETRYPSPVNQKQSFGRENKGMLSDVERAHETSTVSLRAFLSSKDHISTGMNEFRPDFQESLVCPFTRGSKASSSDFTSKSIKEIVSPGLEQHAGHVGRPQSPFDVDEAMKNIKIKDAPHTHRPRYYNESPHDFLDRDKKATAALSDLSQLRKSPSYYRCGVNQGTQFLNACCPKIKGALREGGKVVRLPKIPCLPPDDIDDLIKCETRDVESAWYLSSEEKTTYKKPCPKQQKAQLDIKILVQAHATQICGTPMYSPLEPPDPEDISPEVAASMMFSQEQGIRMEECPNSTIAHLFPDEPKPQFPERLTQGSISVVDPSLKDQEEMIEKSAAVPSEGVSDSAYTRTMRKKREEIGTQRSYDVDFAIGQSKREYVFVAQKPQRINKIQFRGGNSPCWFPGYFSAFPDDEGGLKVVPSPSGLFYKAWICSNPGNMPANDIIVLE